MDLFARRLLVASATLLFAAGALAAPASFTATLSFEFTPGAYLPIGAADISGAGVLDITAGGAISLASGAFAAGATSPGGFTSNADPNSVYVIRNIVNVDNAAGGLSPGAGPGGGFGGLFDTGAVGIHEVGVVPLPNVFGSLAVPLNVAGAGGTGASTLQISANVVTVLMSGTGWTTGGVSIMSPGTGGTLSATGSDGRSAGGLGNLQLVTPFLVTISGAGVGSQAGIATLTFTIPEPGLAMLTGVVAMALAAIGRGRSQLGR